MKTFTLTYDEFISTLRIGHTVVYSDGVYYHSCATRSSCNDCPFNISLELCSVGPTTGVISTSVFNRVQQHHPELLI